MSHIYLAPNAIDMIKKLPPVNGRNGDYGRCYFFKKDNNKKVLFKLFYPPGCEESFPIDTYYNDNQVIIGYTIPYFPGRNLWFKFNDKDEINKLIKAYYLALEILKQHPDILMTDLVFYNILYDSKTNAFYFIDTDKWEVKENGYLENIDNFTKQIMLVLTTFMLKWRDHLLHDKKELYELYCDFVYGRNLNGLFPEFLRILEREISEIKGEKVKTLGELKLLK